MFAFKKPKSFLNFAVFLIFSLGVTESNLGLVPWFFLVKYEIGLDSYGTVFCYFGFVISPFFFQK